MRRYGLAALGGGAIAALVALPIVSGSDSGPTTVSQEAISRAVAEIQDLTPYALLKRGHERAGSDLWNVYAQGVGLRLNIDNPGAKLEVIGDAAIDDLGSAIRAVVRYSGTIPIEGVGIHEVTGQDRVYFHTNGAAQIEAMCLVRLSSCLEVSRLAEMAESALLPRINASGVGAVLPSHGECEVDTVIDSVTRQPSDIATCWYQPGTFLTFVRINQHETTESIRKIAEDPRFKSFFDEILREAR